MRRLLCRLFGHRLGNAISVYDDLSAHYRCERCRDDIVRFRDGRLINVSAETRWSDRYRIISRVKVRVRRLLCFFFGHRLTRELPADDDMTWQRYRCARCGDYCVRWADGRVHNISAIRRRIRRRRQKGA